MSLNLLSERKSSHVRVTKGKLGFTGNNKNI